MLNKKISSGKKSASGVIHTGSCFYYGFVCITGRVDRTVTIYDGVTAAGLEVEDFVADGNKPTDGHSHSDPVVCRNGLYLAISGGSAIVYYSPQG